MQNVQVDDEWEFYIGKLYSHILKNLINFKVNLVVEVGVGFRYKIAYALKDTEFNGTIYIVDINREVLNYVASKYSEILPNAKVITLECEFCDAYRYLPNQVDIFIANHVIDDLILNEYIKMKDDKSIADHKECIFQCWKELKANKTIQNQIIDKTVNDFNNFFQNCKTKLSLLSQYKSNVYLKGCKYLNEIVDQAFTQIKKLFNCDHENLKQLLQYHPFGKNRRYLGKRLLNNTQNENYWIVGNFRN